MAPDVSGVAPTTPTAAMAAIGNATASRRERRELLPTCVAALETMLMKRVIPGAVMACVPLER